MKNIQSFVRIAFIFTAILSLGLTVGCASGSHKAGRYGVRRTSSALAAKKAAAKKAAKPATVAQQPVEAKQAPTVEVGEKPERKASEPQPTTPVVPAAVTAAAPQSETPAPADKTVLNESVQKTEPVKVSDPVQPTAAAADAPKDKPAAPKRSYATVLMFVVFIAIFAVLAIVDSKRDHGAKEEPKRPDQDS